MSERKTLNKYYPPDYNPLEAEKMAKKMSKRLKTMNKSNATIRLMTPFSMKCLKCTEYIPKSRKFNGKKDVLNERYLNSIKIYRLSIRCPRCGNTITFRTDPKNADYIMESGGVKNFMGASKEESNANNADGFETIDEAVDRLVSEEAQSKEVKESDKMEELEKKLMKIQKQQEDGEQLENLRKQNLEKAKRAEKLGVDAYHSEGGNDSEEENKKLDKLVEDAIEGYKRNGQQKSPTPSQSEELTSIAQSSLKAQPITLKRKNLNRKNALGIMVKKRKK
ncbi:hypothetical protein NCAS_0A05280 [Naumovozyma castellii]|uniref:Splicing factor YJU2 n=1 Tax=Naumovozyma castellii TaxID=27288 RepID=G0V6J3_NAUCA|nr:hypothetical protein NCAS_0A05280 [Naumovozyma castellii CBS 4309]CCC67086.1 hypothetical protein NCAS_0A05280 [Naumovozyma castellii CBS 4309]